MFAPYRFETGALRRKTSAGFASGQGFFLGFTPAATGRPVRIVRKRGAIRASKSDLSGSALVSGPVGLGKQS